MVVVFIIIIFLLVFSIDSDIGLVLNIIQIKLKNLLTMIQIILQLILNLNILV